MPKMSIVESAFCRSGPWQVIAKRVVPWATQGFPLSGDVLELGGGGGAMAAALVGDHPSIQLTTTDFDPAMVSAARERTGEHPRITARQADATQLPFTDQSFDATLSFLMLHHVVDWEEAVHEVARVLRPGGQFLGYDLAASRIATWVHVADRSPYRLIGRDEFTPVLRDAGLEPISIEFSFGSRLFRFVARKPDSADGPADNS